MNMIEQLTGFAGKPREWFEEATSVQKYGAMGAIAVFLIALVVIILSVGGGEEEWQEPNILVSETDTCFRKIFAHMKLGQSLKRQGLDQNFSQYRGILQE